MYPAVTAVSNQYAVSMQDEDEDEAVAITATKTKRQTKSQSQTMAFATLCQTHKILQQQKRNKVCENLLLLYTYYLLLLA